MPLVEAVPAAVWPGTSITQKIRLRENTWINSGGTFSCPGNVQEINLFGLAGMRWRTLRVGIVDMVLPSVGFIPSYR